MSNPEPHSLFITKTYFTTSVTILSLFKDNTVFELTGANVIKSDFREHGEFSLTFNGRGVIFGQFIRINVEELILEWNVSGFQQPDETKTILEIGLRQEKDKCILTLNHKNISFVESAKAKQRAWSEILDGIEQHLNNPLN